MKRFTASKAGLLTNCSYWLRDGVLWEESTRGPGAKIGSVVHRFIELVLCGTKPTNAMEEAQTVLSQGMDEHDREEALSMCLSWMRWFNAGNGLAGIVKECLRPMDETTVRSCLYVEPMFAWNPSTGVRRFIGQRLERQYEETHQPGEVGGTADVVLLSGGTLIVVDWKTCQPFAEVPSAVEQLLTLALLCRGLFSDVKKIKIVSVGVDKQSVRIGTDMEVSPFELAQFEDAVKLRLSEAEKSLPVPGAHCYGAFCPARRFCPATQQTMTKLVNDSEGRELLPVITSDEQCVWTHEKLKVVKDQYEAIKDAVALYIASRGGRVSKGNGRALGQVQMPGRKSFNQGAAVEALRGYGWTDTQLSELWNEGKPYVQIKEVKE